MNKDGQLPLADNKKEVKVLKKRIFGSFFATQKRQKKVYEQIKERAAGDFDFYIMSLFAGIIITLGIIIDSAAVVIGGMLIAPLVWPILAMALGVCMGRPRLLQTALGTILKSTLVILLVAILLGLIVPDLVIENKEFLQRTSPTLFELLIGLAAGFVGAFIIAYPKIGSAIAGVVMAAAIVPPIATIGLSIGRGDFDAAAGALLLFLSNLIAITFAATILFLISNFSPTSEIGHEKSKSGFRWSLLFLVIIFIPLILTTKQTAEAVKNNKIIKGVVQSSLEQVSVSELQISEQNGILTASLTLNANESITKDQISAMENILLKQLGKPVILKIKILPVVEAGDDVFSKWKKIMDIESALEQEKQKQLEQEKLDEDLVKCPVAVNGIKIIRAYPISIGCPVCPKVISCGDGREFPGQSFNEALGECEDLLFAGGAPCFQEASE